MSFTIRVSWPPVGKVHFFPCIEIYPSVLFHFISPPCPYSTRTPCYKANSERHIYVHCPFSINALVTSMRVNQKLSKLFPCSNRKENCFSQQGNGNYAFFTIRKQTYFFGSRIFLIASPIFSISFGGRLIGSPVLVQVFTKIYHAKTKNNNCSINAHFFLGNFGASCTPGAISFVLHLA